MNSINLQKSLEKLALLNLIQERLDGNHNSIANAIRISIVDKTQETFDMIKSMTEDNPDMMKLILGEPLLDKILNH